MPAASVGRDARCRDVTVAWSVVTERFFLLSLLLRHNKMGSFGGVNLGRVWQVISSEASSDPCH